jgi:ribosomal RNA-processing protein 36
MRKATRKGCQYNLHLQVDREWRAGQAAKGEGKTPFYLKASDRKKLLLAKKFEKLEAEGKLQKYLEKKQKRNASRDHKKLPFRMR